MKKTNVITCQCQNPDVEYLDSSYVDHWVCRTCHHFGGCHYPAGGAESPTIHKPTITYNPAMRCSPMNQCPNSHDIQHLEDKIDDFRNAAHDKLLGYGAFSKGVGIGLLIMVIIIFFIIALGIFNFNPIVQPAQQGGQVAPTAPAPTSPPTSPFPTLP